MKLLSFAMTILLIILPTIASSICFSAFLTTRKRALAYLSVFAIGYAAEQVFILYRSFVYLSAPAQDIVFSGVEDPLIHILLGAIMCEALMMAALEYFDTEKQLFKLLPLVVFVAACLAVYLLPHTDASLKKWLMYTMRQAFLIFIALYCFTCYSRISEGAVKKRYHKRRLQFLIISLLIFLTLLEDTYVMLFMPIDQVDPVFLELLYRRNICESVLAIVGACFLVYIAIRPLRIHPTSASQMSTRALDEEETLAFFSERYNLTMREREVMRLVVKGYDNQNIASEFQLAVGTVKAHLNHIFKKAGCSSREELMERFWMSS